MKPYRSILLCIISSTLLILSYPLANIWFLAWIALAPLFFAIKNEKIINVFLLGFLTGLVFFYGAIYWLNSIAIPATLGLVFYLSFYFAAFAVFAKPLLNKNIPIFIRAVIIAAWWVALEFIRSNLLTGFGWALLGYSQTSFLPVIQIADIAGAWGVSFIIVFVNVSIYEFFIRGAHGSSPLQLVGRLAYNRLINLLLCVFLTAAVFVYGFNKLHSKPGVQNPVSVKISLIQGNIPQSLKWDEAYKNEIIKKYFGLTMAAAQDKPDMIIWPETAYPADLILEPAQAKELFNLSKAVNANLLIGANRYEHRNFYNSAIQIGPDGAIKAHYDKLHLVPFGEFVPKLPKIIFKILPEKINMVGDFSPGENSTVFNAVGKTVKECRFGVLICFEDLFPDLAARLVKNGSQFLVNITNDGWYGVSSAPFEHAQASVFRAVENRVPVVRSTNTGYSIFIDKNGKIMDEITPFTNGYKTKDVQIGVNNELTPLTVYNRYPHVLIVISFLLSLVGFGIILFHSRLKD